MTSFTNNGKYPPWFNGQCNILLVLLLRVRYNGFYFTIGGLNDVIIVVMRVRMQYILQLLSLYDLL